MKKLIQIAVLQVVLGLVFIGGAKGAAEYTCGDSIPYTDSLADVTCSCEGTTWTEYEEGILWNFERKYCCGWVEEDSCKRADPTSLKAVCGETYDRAEKDECICGGSSSETTMDNGQICCGWLINGRCEAIDVTINDATVAAQTLNKLNPLIIGSGDASLSTPGGIISKALGSYIFPIAGVILFIQLLLGGFQMMTGAGNSKSTSEGGQKITSALIGFVLIFAAYWIAQLLELILDINILS